MSRPGYSVYSNHPRQLLLHPLIKGLKELYNLLSGKNFHSLLDSTLISKKKFFPFFLVILIRFNTNKESTMYVIFTYRQSLYLCKTKINLTSLPLVLYPLTVLRTHHTCTLQSPRLTLPFRFTTRYFIVENCEIL